MCHSTEDRDDLLGLILPLDDCAGPARRISRQKIMELVRAALEAASVTPPFTAPVLTSSGSRTSRTPGRGRFLKK